MKKFTLLSLLLIILLTLSGCQMVTIDKQTKLIKDHLKTGITLETVQPVYFTDTSFPELLVISHSDEYTFIQIHQYDQENKKWRIVYNGEKHPHYNGLEKLKIMDTLKDDQTKLEHVFIGYHGGTGGFLNFYALGVNQKGTITKIVDKMLNEHAHSSIKDTANGFDLYSGDELVESYYWDDNHYILTD